MVVEVCSASLGRGQEVGTKFVVKSLHKVLNGHYPQTQSANQKPLIIINTCLIKLTFFQGLLESNPLRGFPRSDVLRFVAHSNQKIN